VDQIGIGLVGYKFMGRAHSNAFRQVAYFFDVTPKPRLRALCGRTADVVQAAAGQLGWESWETDWRRLVERDDIQLIDVSTPGNTHRDIAVAALEAGKHVLCEKPLANSLAEAEQMLRAARASGRLHMVCFNYRRTPAVQLARRLIEAGQLGEVRHWRATYLQDWLVDPSVPLTWRLRKETAGSGTLGDIGAHLIDLAHFLVGPIAEVVSTATTFIKQRPLEGSTGTGQVTVDDACAFLARFENGATGTFEATRFAPGRKAYNAFEVNGSRGSLAFNFERMNELQVYSLDDEPSVGGFRTVLVTEPTHPYLAAWWPPGHTLGYEHTFVHTVKDLLDGLRDGVSPAPSFDDGYRCQSVLDAAERSLAERGWVAPRAAPEL
jgi:predicted dehydrogenase